MTKTPKAPRRGKKLCRLMWVPYITEPSQHLYDEKCDAEREIDNGIDEAEPVLVLRVADLPEIAERMAEAIQGTISYFNDWDVESGIVLPACKDAAKAALAAIVPKSVMKGMK